MIRFLTRKQPMLRSLSLVANTLYQSALRTHPSLKVPSNRGLTSFCNRNWTLPKKNPSNRVSSLFASKPRLFVSRFISSLSMPKKQLNDADELAEWMKSNTDLPAKDIQLILSQKITGLEALSPSIASFEIFRKKFPDSTPRMWKSILQLRLATLIPTSLKERTANIKKRIFEIPFVGREAAIQAAVTSVNAHIMEPTDSSDMSSRSKNVRLFAVGAPGIGKTRFGEEFPRLLKQHVFPSVQEKLDNVRTVLITFENGRALTTDDLKWRTKKEQVDWILTSRAVFATYNIKLNYYEWAPRLASMLGDELPLDFNMKTFTRELLVLDKPSTLYFHMDEVQTVLTVPQIGAELIRQMSYLYASFNSPELFTLLLYTGTVLSDIKTMLSELNVGNSPDYPIQALPMETLTEDNVVTLLNTMKQENKLPWLEDDWQSNAAFMKLLAHTGGVPRIIELLLVVRKKESNLEEVVSILTNRIRIRYSITLDSQLLQIATWIALSNKSYAITDTLPNYPTQTIEHLRENGYIFFASGNTVDIPFLYLRMVVTNSWESTLQQRKFSSEVSAIWAKLTSPNITLSWNDFESFSLVYTILRIKALLGLGYTTISVKEYFKHAQVAANIEDLNLKLTKRTLVVLANRWPQTALPTYTLGGSIETIPADELDRTLFLNAAGAPFDGFEFVETESASPKYLVFAHQNKHTVAGKTKLTSAAIKHEKQKTEASFERWKQEIAANPKFSKFTNSRIILVVYTNRSTVIDEKIPNLDDLIIVNNPAHFGPFRSMIKFFKAPPKET